MQHLVMVLGYFLDDVPFVLATVALFGPIAALLGATAVQERLNSGRAPTGGRHASRAYSSQVPFQAPPPVPLASVHLP